MSLTQSILRSIQLQRPCVIARMKLTAPDGGERFKLQANVIESGEQWSAEADDEEAAAIRLRIFMGLAEEEEDLPDL